MHLYYSEKYCDTDVDFETTRKARGIYQSLQRWPIGGVEVREPRSASDRELAQVHSPPYLEALRTGRPYELAASNGLGWDRGLYRAVLSSTGGVRDAALTALLNGVAGSLSSGLHHAHRDAGRGFCTINGLCVAASASIAAGARRILILDLDAHCGGGTADIIATIPEVEQVDVSVVDFDAYATDDRDDLTLVMATAEGYPDAVEDALLSIRSPQTIDLVIYNAGMDAHEQAGGIRGITADVLAAREATVFAWAAKHRLSIAFVLAGGYTSTGFMPDDLIELHRLTISTAARAATTEGARWN